MVLVTKLVTIFLISHLVAANVTRVSRENVLLSRKRRYLNFPKGSNFVVTLSLIKFLPQVQPRGWAILLEADVPFELPSDVRALKNKKTKRYSSDRRSFLGQMGSALTGVGLDGEACINKIICSILQHKLDKKSLTRDLLYAAFIYPEDNLELYSEKCTADFPECSIPLLENLIETGFSTEEKYTA